MFLLILVQDADGDMPQSLYPKLVTVTRSWYVLLMAFVLQVIRCGICVEVRCRNVIVGWRVRGGHSHEPKQQFSSAIFFIYYILPAVSCYRNLHQGFSGFALFNSSSKWTFNVQELLTLRGSVGTGSTWFSLNRCIQVSSSSSLSHFKFDVQELGLGTTWQVFRSFSWILVVPF